jgi:hypothetical protein
LWQKRTRACIETTASLIFCAGAEIDWFGDILKLLGDIGHTEKTRENSLIGKDQSFVMYWTCLSLMAIRPILEQDWLKQEGAGSLMMMLEEEENTGQGQTTTVARKIDETFENACRCLEELSEIAAERSMAEDQATEILRGYEPQIAQLELINVEADDYKQVDRWMRLVQTRIGADSHGIITDKLPGVKFNDFPTDSVHFSHTVEWYRNPLQVQFIFPAQNLKSICSLAPTLRDILDGHWDANAFQEAFKSLEELMQVPNWQQNRNLLQRQLWRLQDLRDGGGLGFTVELFFLALKQLLSTSSSHSALYIGTFRAITSNWEDFKGSPGTQKVLLDLAASYNGIISDFDYPTYITDELLELLRKIFEGQSGDHIDYAVQQVTLHHSFERRPGRKAWWTKVLEVLTPTSASLPGLHPLFG